MNSGGKPISVHSYHKDIIDIYKKKIEDNNDNLIKYSNQVLDNYKYIRDHESLYLNKYDIDLNSFEEYKNNKYKDGSLIDFIQNKLIDNAGDNETCTQLFYILNYAKAQKELCNFHKIDDTYKCIIKLTDRQYVHILNIFYNKVQALMVKYGYAYKYENIGYFAVNRFKVANYNKIMMDYKATKIRKQELLAAGKRLYNKFDEKWCKEHNIEYNGVKYIVPTSKTHCFEIVLFKKENNLKNIYFYANQYRGDSISKLPLDKILEICPTADDILKLNMDIKCKANLCCQLDDNIIKNITRYEDEKSVRDRKVDRKD